MKKTLLVLLSILVYLNISAQSSITIKLKPDTVLKGIQFSCLKVLDARDYKENIGYFTRGITHNGTQVKLPGEFNEYIEKTITELLPQENPKLVLIFRNFSVSENIGTQNQYGYCNIEIEFAREEDTALYSLGTFYANISEHANKIKYSHEKRILLGLEECFRKFDNSDWKNNNGTLIKEIKPELDYDYKTVPPAGVYFNYNQTLRKSPAEFEFEIKLAKQSKDVTTYSIDFKNKVNLELILFVSDGKHIYMRANQTQFIRSGAYGKYIYFQGRVPITTNTEQSVYLVSLRGAGFGALVGGIAGGLLFTIASSNGTSTNTSTKGVILDTETGNLKVITDLYIYKITKDFPEIIKEYRHSNRKLADKEQVIINLNSKY
jgi:hypothetical protein